MDDIRTPSAAPIEAPLPIRASATVLLCRDGGEGLEVFMVQRHSLSDVHGGSYVFPGGKLDAADALLDADRHLDQSPAELHARLNEPDIDAATAAALHVAAVREAYEECGVLLAHDVGKEGIAQAASLAAAGVGFNEMLASLQLRLDTRSLEPWSRWITPEKSLTAPGKRFDTRFFVAAAPDGQVALHDDHEAIASRWWQPRSALAAYWQREIVLAPPQIMSLAHLARYPTLAGLLAEAGRRPPCVVRPQVFSIDGVRGTAYPGDPLHPELLRVMPGPLRLLMRGTRLEPPGGFDDFFE
ncbi:conserved hypothetical protein [Burkholderiales bacterium 8X]|nr:conserved hypothetical protein [Burkholderiales bacterium 8X]